MAVLFIFIYLFFVLFFTFPLLKTSECVLLFFNGSLGVENACSFEVFLLSLFLLLTFLGPAVCVRCRYGSVSLGLGDGTPGLNQSQLYTYSGPRKRR